MKILIAEDDLASRMFMKKYLGSFGTCDVAVNGIEAIDSATEAIMKNEPYDLICLDIMMPMVDGLKALKNIREVEEKLLDINKKPSKVIMTTAINDKETIEAAYDIGCEGYAWKPIDFDKFEEVLRNLDLIQ